MARTMKNVTAASAGGKHAEFDAYMKSDARKELEEWRKSLLKKGAQGG